MPYEQTIQERSYQFAVAMVLFYEQTLQSVPVFLREQMVRSATSIAANVAESRSAISTADFTNKMYIACKESRETLFWLQLLRDTHKVPTQQIEPHINACDELLRILITTTKRLKHKSGE